MPSAYYDANGWQKTTYGQHVPTMTKLPRSTVMIFGAGQLICTLYRRQATHRPRPVF